MTTANDIYTALGDFAAAVTGKFQGMAAGEPEEQLRAPFDALLQAVGAAASREVVCVGETLLPGRLGKPDYAVHCGGLLAGYAELKAPGKGVERSGFSGRDREQFDRFAELPNLLYTDGNEWALYRYGEPAAALVRLAGNLTRDGRLAVGRPAAMALQRLLVDFLSWQPIIPTDGQGRIALKEFAAQLAPLCRFLRDDVAESLSSPASPLHRVAAGWRDLLFPNASNEQFADAYAQTALFALLLARSQGAGVGNGLTWENAPDALRRQHNLLSSALAALTDHRVRREIAAALDLVLRLMGAVNPESLAAPADPWLYFYEDFLAEYDPKLRKNAGVYYTPVEIVRAQVRLVDSLLVNQLGQPQGFAAPEVITLDPAAGTGTYLLGIIEHTLQRVAAQQGGGAVAGQATQLAQNLYGFELMVGPYAVTELRVANALRGRGALLPEDGAQVYLTDTLESPHRQPIQGYFGPAQALSQEHERALQVKRETGVLVCLGNPPYDRHRAAAAGGWVRQGDDGIADRPILSDFLESARAAGHGVHLKNLYNLYVYFWRWALWKVFEQPETAGPGVVSFISAASYLEGKAFAGMREHLRRICDEIWILDLGGDGRGPRKSENVFNIQTPVAIAIAYRQGQPTDEPARVHYARIAGSRAEKLAALAAIDDFAAVDWRECPEEWQAPFHPAGTGPYFAWPLLADLMPWQHSGVQLKRTWPIGADTATLERRWRELLRAADKATAFRETEDRRLSGSYRSVLLSGSETTPLDELAVDAPPPPIIRYAYRFLDRQSLIADGRLISRPRPSLWRCYGSNRQVYLMSRMTRLLGPGPALVASALLPDLDHQAAGGKDVMPLYRDSAAAEPNIRPGLLALLSARYGYAVTPEDFAAYLYGILGQPAFTRRYYNELKSRQVRVPLTADAALFRQGRDLGAYLLWLHTYGESHLPEGWRRGQVPNGAARCTVAVPQEERGYPESFRYDAAAETLHVGAGQFAPVTPEVYDYSVSGLKVVQSWLKYRMRDGAGKKSSPLDDIRPATWPARFTEELLELLWVLAATVATHPRQEELLAAIVNGPILDLGQLPPIPEVMRQPPPEAAGAERLV